MEKCALDRAHHFHNGRIWGDSSKNQRWTNDCRHCSHLGNAFKQFVLFHHCQKFPFRFFRESSVWVFVSYTPCEKKRLGSRLYFTISFSFLSFVSKSAHLAPESDPKNQSNAFVLSSSFCGEFLIRKATVTMSVNLSNVLFPVAFTG